MKKKLQNVPYELLPFSIHNHLFCYLWGSRTAGKCRLCTRYFIEDTDQASYLDFNFIVNKDDLKEFEVYSLIQDSVDNRFTLSIYYIVRQQWLEVAVGGKSENYGEVFKEVVISPLSLYIMFLNVLIRVYFNSLRDVTDVIEYHVDPVARSKQRKRLLFSIFKKFRKSGKVIMKTYNLLLSDFTFSYIFSTYKAKIDYST